MLNTLEPVATKPARACLYCGKDISHMKANAIKCGGSLCNRARRAALPKVCACSKIAVCNDPADPAEGLCQTCIDIDAKSAKVRAHHAEVIEQRRLSQDIHLFEGQNWRDFCQQWKKEERERERRRPDGLALTEWDKPRSGFRAPESGEAAAIAHAIAPEVPLDTSSHCE